MVAEPLWPKVHLNRYVILTHRSLVNIYKTFSMLKIKIRQMAAHHPHFLSE